jgi:hypothetical protein
MRKQCNAGDLGIAHACIAQRATITNIMEGNTMRGSSSSTSSRSSRSSSSSSSSSRGRSRRGGRRSQTPVSRLKNSISNRITKNTSSRFWGYVLGSVGLIGAGYGLMQISGVRSFMKPVIDPVSNLFGLLEDDGIDTSNLTHDRTYSGSSVGSSSVGSSSMVH